ncbi:Alpha/beta hydrolase domain-containing protein 17C [Taenia solium]|eukprot:TsM_000003200 transcript=TsM_000003200 gene=TsM_000003200
MGSLFGEICHIFCCPPRPSHIVAKFAFLPPIPTYTIVQSPGGSEWQIIFKPEVGLISDYAKSRMEVFYTMTKRKSRIACLYIHYDATGPRHSLSTSASGSDPASRITILFSHGNAVDIGQMAGFLFSLSQRFGVNVLVYDYSGYGASTGQTLEANLYADGEAALVELRERYLCPLNRIVLYGQSIGTAPTVELATHYAVAGVVLHSALMSGLRVVCPGTTRRFCFDPFNRQASFSDNIYIGLTFELPFTTCL